MHIFAAIENIFFLVLVAIVGLVRWIAQVAENKRNADAAKRASPPSNAPAPRAPALSEDERVRKFMEALGVPASTTPPQKPPARQITPKRPRELQRKVRPIDPFPRPATGAWKPPASIPTIAAAIPTQTPTADAPPPVLRSAPFTASPLLPTEFEVDVRPPASGWARRLGSSEGLREAIVLREIFGPPRSLQV